MAAFCLITHISIDDYYRLTRLEKDAFLRMAKRKYAKKG